MTRIGLLVLASLLGSSAALGQAVQLSIPQGARVRVIANDARGILRFEGQRADTLVLRHSETDAALVLPLSTVQRLSVSGGRRSAGAGALRGLGIGLGIGVAGGAIVGALSPVNEDAFIEVSRGESVAFGAILFGGLGAALGTLAGLSNPGEKWERVDLRRLRVSAGAGGGGSVGVSFTF